MTRHITEDDLRGLPGVRRSSIAAIVARQPRTVRECIAIVDVGRKTAKRLLQSGLLTDPDGALHAAAPRP
jgi:hypothetical protein